jgi:hypothetical protein
MKEYLRFWFLNRIIKNPVLTTQIYEVLYLKRTFTAQQPIIQQIIQQPTKVESISSNSISVPSKKEEMIQALQHLKNKTFKTKQEKDSISVLETVLKNKY